jgi:Core-2/I-Branching enzyme
MKIVYLILCHKEPWQVVGLVNRLNDHDVSFVIHVDRRSKMTSEAIEASLATMPNVRFAKRHICYWGRIGIVLATLSCIDEALKADFDYAVLLSGQDYPLHSNSFIKKYLADHEGNEFIEAFPLLKPNAWTNQGGPYQAEYRAFGFTLSWRSRVLFTKWKRKFPLGYLPYGGSQWWCLSKRALNFVSEFYKNNRSIRRFFKYTHVPDEIIFQSILANSEFSNRIRTSLTYVNWRVGPPYPKILDETDLPTLRQATDFLFGRKFDHIKSDGLMAALDQPPIAKSA